MGGKLATSSTANPFKMTKSIPLNTMSIDLGNITLIVMHDSLNSL